MVREQSDVLKAALRYAEQGLEVFPVHGIDAEGLCTCGNSDCTSPGKHPIAAGGFKNATKDPVKVRKAFSRPGLNVGIATGSPSGWWVLDLDGEAGIAALDRWRQEARADDLPPFPVVRTGGGGMHVFFRCDGEEIRNTSKVGGVPVDVRGDGGYIVAPPSRHASGRSYAWDREIAVALEAPAPGWILDRVRRKPPAATTAHGVDRQRGMVFEVAGDLGSHPGEAEGSRHSTAAKLIGGDLASGLPLEKVRERATGFAARCTPPMQPAEVLRIVEDLAGRRAVEISVAEDRAESLDLPPSRWPTMAPEAFQGPLGEIVRAIEPHSEADPAAILVSLLAMYGNAVGRGPHFVVEGTMHRPNLFAVIVGSTSGGRKGTGGGRAKEVFGYVDLQWVADRMQGGLVSGEGLIFAVRDPVLGIDRKGLPTTIDPGVTDKRLMITEPEFGGVLRVVKREENTLSPTLRQAWDGGTLRTLAKNSKTIATEPHISIVGHITREELSRTLAEVEVFNGLGNRFLWILSRRSKLLPGGGGDLDLAPFANRLKEHFDAAARIGRMVRSEAAEKLWTKIYLDFADQSSPGLLGAILSRAEPQTLRLAIVYALAEGSPVIEPQHLEAGLAVWRYAEQSAGIIFGRSTGSTIDDRILEAIRKAPGISRRELHKALGNHTAAEELVAVLGRLRDAGLARFESTPTAGRPREAWFPGGLRTNERSTRDPAGDDGEQGEQSERRGDADSAEGLTSFARTPTRSKREVFKL
jgi:hypothetical protein